MSEKMNNIATFVLVPQSNKSSIFNNFRNLEANAVRCFLCNNFFTNDEISWMIFEKYSRDDNLIENSLATILSTALGLNLKAHKTHSSVLCNKCKNLTLEFEKIEQQLSEIRYQILVNYNRTAKLYNLKPIPIEINGVLQNTEYEYDFNDNYDKGNNDDLDNDDLDNDDLIDVADEFVYNENEQQNLLSSQSEFMTTDDIDESSLIEVASDGFNEVLNDDNEIKSENFHSNANGTHVSLITKSEDDFIINFKVEPKVLIKTEQENQNDLLIYDENETSHCEQQIFTIDNTEENNVSKSKNKQQHLQEKSKLEEEDFKTFIKLIQNNFEDVYVKNVDTKNLPTTKKLKLTLKKRNTQKNTEDQVTTKFEIINGNYKCLICTNDFSYDCKSFMEHMRKEHNLRFYFCDACPRVFKRRLELTAHIEEQHNDGSLLICDVCQRSFVNYRFFQMHKRMHIIVKCFKCNNCNKRYNSKTLLEEHLQTHNNHRTHHCQECNKDFASKYTLQTHLKIHTKRERRFQCAICNKTFFSQQSMQNHRWVHEGVRSYHCEDCGKSFTTQHNLDIHMVVHTGQRPFACSLCEKTFARRAEVKDHERTHTGERPFKCDICEASFAQRANLMSHRKSTHFNEKLHKCGQCGRSFKRRRLLNYHINAAHTGIRPYKCDVCGSSFVYPEHYKKHLILHTGAKPYACEVCGKTFSSRDNRNAHRFIHSHKKPYECLQCGAGFMRKPMLLAHMKHTNHQNDTIIINQPQLPIPQVAMEDTETLDYHENDDVDDVDTGDDAFNAGGKDSGADAVNVDTVVATAVNDANDVGNCNEDCTKLVIGENEKREGDNELLVPVEERDIENKYMKFADLDDETLDW